MPIITSSVRVGDPVRYKVLSLFPLFSGTEGGVEYLLSGEAFEAGLLRIGELSESGSVAALRVENRGDSRVLLIEGEELIGAKQNRILNTSVLIAPHSRTRIPVSCVEQGRWAYRSKGFASSRRYSPSKLHYHLKRSVNDSLEAGRGHVSDQHRVWEEVAREQSELRVPHERRRWPIRSTPSRTGWRNTGNA